MPTTRAALAVAASAALAAAGAARTYDVTILERNPQPAMSLKLPPGKGYSPCEFTFNPAWLEPDGVGLNRSILIFRASNCPPSYGGAEDHLLFAYCNSDGTCGDAQDLAFPFEPGSEDPRVFYYNSTYWMFYFANGVGQSTVYLRKTATPLDPASWESVLPAPLPWHRNGCVILRDAGGPHYVIFGETGALPGIGIAKTTDFVSYDVLNATWLEPLGANNTAEPEIVLEAATHPVKLSTGDYFHIYAAGTPGWVAKGNYTGGWLILDGDDPTRILQRSAVHTFVSTEDYEVGDGIWPVNRNRTLFITSVVPVPGAAAPDTFRLWYGAAGASRVASARAALPPAGDPSLAEQPVPPSPARPPPPLPHSPSSILADANIGTMVIQVTSSSRS